VSAARTLGLKCRLCGAVSPASAGHFCADDFGPLDVAYDDTPVRRETIERRPWTLWRYRELLPLEGEPTAGLHAGGTPLIRAERLAAALGVRSLWLKNEAACQPTLSFKDRVCAVALSKARELGLRTVACSSTGNLAHAVAANAAAAGLDSWVFVPADLDPDRVARAAARGARVVGVKGTYDDVNRLCSEAADRFGWGFVNVNLRPYYCEGAKTVGLEIAEQLGWRLPRHVVAPVAGGALLVMLGRAFAELAQVGLIATEPCSIHAAQASGCNPLSAAVKNGWPEPRPVRRPATRCTSLAVGDPGDGYFALEQIRASGGWAEDATDDEAAAAVELLARTEGVCVELAGGVTIAATRKLIEQGRIGRDEEIVVCLTGSGLREPPAAAPGLTTIEASLEELEALVIESEPEA
jgi:threonine synthase